MPTALFLLWLLIGQAAPPQTACEAALAAGVGPGSAEACQGDQARKAADTAGGPAAERARQLADAVEHYERAANLLANPSAKARVLAELVRLFDPAILNRPADLEAVLKQLTVLEPATLTWQFRLSRVQEDWGRVDLAEDTLISVRRQNPGELEPVKQLAQFYVRRVAALQPPAAVQAAAAPTKPGEPDDQGVYRVGGAITPPRRSDQPKYPADAQAAGVQGVVVAEIVINEDGLVSDARIVRSIPLLDEAALKAVMNWRYDPTLVNGKPVPIRSTVTVNFTTSK